MRRFLLRLGNLFRRRGAEREMTREIESHLALLQEEFERRGLSVAEAALAARRAYGGVEQAKELHREARSFVGIEQLLKDLRYGWRSLLRNPGFTLTAVMALGLGIGVNATVFGIFNAVAWKQLPVADAGRVVRIKRWFQNFSMYRFAYPEYQYLRDRNDVFAGMVAAVSDVPVMASIPGGGSPEHLTGSAVSANYFAVLGVRARFGRTFLPDEDRAAGANPVVVLGYRFWRRKFQADASTLGQTIRLNETTYSIIGVAPPEFTGTGSMPTEPALWAPLSMMAQLNPGVAPGWRDEWRDANAYPGFELLARLKDGVSRATAQAQTALLMRGYLAGYREPNRTTAVTLEKTSYFGGAGDPAFQALAWVVLLIVAMVLLVACANVANMLLARGMGRQREIGVRLALGASRGRVVRQLLAESVLLSLLGGAAGLLLSAWAGRLAWAALTGILQGFRALRFEVDVSPDAHVWIYGLALSLFTGIVSGLAPALQSTRLDLSRAIAGDGGPQRTIARSTLRGLLLGGQVTVSVLLLIASGGLMRGVASSFVGASVLGFDTHDTYRLQVGKANDPGTLPRLRQRLETLPELSGVAIGGAPLRENLSIPLAGKANGQVVVSFASDQYFETLGIRLVRGRGFTRQEAEGGAPVAIVSESTARRLWPGGRDPVGQVLSLDRSFTHFIKFTDAEVVGVARDVRFAQITEVDSLHVYLPAGATTHLLGGLVLRIHGSRDKALAAVESAVESVDESLLPGLEMVNLEEGPVALQRGFVRVIGVFAGVLTLLALTLAAVGIYGVMAFLVSQRTQEIGIRMALGATPRTVLRHVLIQGLRPVFVGIVLGLGVAAALSGPVQRVVVAPGMFPQWGTPVLVAELALMLAIAVLASVVPARRALRVDPAEALRHE